MLTDLSIKVASAAPAAWDVMTFLKNFRDFIQNGGNLILFAAGTLMLVWGGIQLARKLMGNQQTAAQISWFTIALLLIIGGALMAMGFGLVSMIGSGGQKTIEDLGMGAVALGALT